MTFGETMQALMTERAMSLRGLAKVTHYDVGYLSKVSRDLKPPSAPMAEALDDALSANGALLALVPPKKAPKVPDSAGLAKAQDIAVEATHTMPLLLSESPFGASPTGSNARLTVDGVEALLGRLYRLDAEFGGNELCFVIAEHVQTASGLFNAETLRSNTEQRLFVAVAGLTQIAGWLSIDANRHGDANRYLAATVYAAHEIDDLGLAGHALGYMSLHAFYRNQPQKALALARTGSELARTQASPRVRATLHNRAARAHARLGAEDACRRRLDKAKAAYAADSTSEVDPQWVGYVTDVEIAAQRGACFLDLKRPDDAVTTLTEAITLVEETAPDHVRDLAHYKTRLASAHLLQREPERAANVAIDAHRLATTIGSARVRERFDELLTSMEPYDIPEVRDLVEQLRRS